MDINPFPQQILQVLLRDAADRDPVTARRAALLKILLHERYLTREQLIIRVEGLLGKGCFGKAAWEDVFYRDLRLVKDALKAAGHHLAYSRSRSRPGYFLRGQAMVSAELSEILRQCVAEVDPAQIQILHNLKPADRFRLGCSLTDTARSAVVYRVSQQHPELSITKARYFALQGKLPDERKSDRL